MTKWLIFRPLDPRKKLGYLGLSSTAGGVLNAKHSNCLAQTVWCCRDSLHSRLAPVEPQITH